MSDMIRHYSGQAIKQAYVIIFGLDVIGNPYGLVVGVSRSLEDFFYEPFQVICYSLIFWLMHFYVVFI